MIPTSDEKYDCQNDMSDQEYFVLVSSKDIDRLKTYQEASDGAIIITFSCINEIYHCSPLKICILVIQIQDLCPAFLKSINCIPDRMHKSVYQTHPRNPLMPHIKCLKTPSVNQIRRAFRPAKAMRKGI